MSEYMDEFIRRSLRIARVGEGEAIAESKNISELHKKIKSIMLGLGADVFSISAKNKAQIEIAKLINAEYKSMSDRASEIALEMIEKEQEWQINAVSEYIDEPMNKIPHETAVNLSRDLEYQGKTFAKWFEEAGVTYDSKVRGVIDDGFVQGRSIPEITNDVALLSGKSKSDVKTLVRSNIMSIAQRAREEIIEVNRDIYDGKMWNSTLDVRTTPHICGVRDQAKYDLDGKPIGHSNPWGAGPGMIHFNCRSIAIPIIKGVDIKAPRPSIDAGDSYEKGDKTTNRGTVRKPTKANRDNGTYEISKVPAGTKYEEWLRNQPEDFIADALGSKERANALKEGTALSKIISSPLGTPINFNDL